jgi:hypothetical protein
MLHTKPAPMTNDAKKAVEITVSKLLPLLGVIRMLSASPCTIEAHHPRPPLNEF